MKAAPANFLAAAALLLLACSARAQQEYITEPPLPGQQPGGLPTDVVKYTLLKPNDKTSERVQDSDRNPFSKSDSELQSQTQKGTNEENQIREILEKLRVVGVTPGGNGLRVMLGDMVLEQGQIVPQVLPQQTIALRVESIAPDAINLVWVEAKPTGLPPRTLTIGVDLRPYVRVKLMGQSNERNRWEKQSEEAPGVPVARQFSGESAPTLKDPTTSSRSAPASRPGAAPTPAAAPPAAQAQTPPAVPAAASPPEAPSSPEWDYAMKLMQKLMPANPPRKK